MKTTAALLAALALAPTPWPQSEPPILAPDAKLEKLAGAFRFTEGPAADAHGNVYFTDQPNDRILVWTAKGKLETFLEPSGRANGLWIDKNGFLWACADERNELVRIDLKTKERTVVVKDHDGKLLNGPNDVWVAPDGSAWFTNPYYRRSYWKRPPEEQTRRAVYRVSPEGRLDVVDDDFAQPNGIVGTLDGKTLYVSDIDRRRTYRYDIGAGGRLEKRRVHCEAGSDGMTLDSDGNLYLTGKEGVSVYDGSGKLLGTIAVPERWTANVCFGGVDFKTLFITASTGLYSIRTRVRGMNAP
jgi:gluconolactonase